MTRRFLFALALLAASCTSPDTTSLPPARPPAAQQQATLPQLPLPLNSAVLLDSSDYVLYPLTLAETNAERDGEYVSKGYNHPATYWNILFYNLRTGQSRLLADRQKLLITAYSGVNPDNSLPQSRAGKALYYSVIIDDTDHDGKLTDEDPTYLFASDQSGENFRQLSPKGVSVTNWQRHAATGKILLQTLLDSNHDHKFGAGDEAMPYVVGDATARQPATRPFSAAFLQGLKTQLQAQWGQSK